ncbi:keto-deoxy-phosphogluconate aldolase [Actinoalloteichus sp. AHMU CJ021]|uniref:2-dehydro-3-deoxy-phosphogluconate aldolase n=1 Tax=Actinoalloteichus caeruleus DSM 43889 TaxID=1120930 RepID=A0ABT1JH28_ACTCY|nr:bifunctional 4-hydroxy-2-oxoglutarate aldolase/2-dehydro-3-deoxy-phosphogluconate aldolase [Actinoalloteichus caeruleus]AUS77849.1 keto-deoxy-phosphogluconate aldolase [Actinoalloteichus sp. AHMU CJ021]MCP2331805.1 2-dehydro-3-deoxyphosphogluconate aldolase / (4S)-4-hydroxy-2-oxoglutarate aldolase [Actinoalloteichus caeruleus DSM 43889]
MSQPGTATDLLTVAPVVPVVVLEDVEHAVPLARALLAGGLPVIELTLRTPAALEGVRRIADEVPEIALGVGTVTTPEQARLAAESGAGFLVTPGGTERLLDAVEDTGLPFLAGVSTVSEALRLAERGHRAMKFFPAEAAGGAAYLKSLGGPLPELRFCPTGGITTRTAADYLALPNVGCVGGSWLTPRDLLAAGDWTGVADLARAAASLRTA